MSKNRTKILTLGEILVEFVAEKRGRGFRSPLGFSGPFPSGAPAIFIDQVAKLGHPCGMIGCVGDDDFGRLNLERLRSDGVDVGGIRIDPAYPTGSAFVRYRPDGGRDFIFNIRQSAAGRLTGTEGARRLLAECGHLHLMGSSLYSEKAISLAQRAVRAVKGVGGTISFDPNIRVELLRGRGMRPALEWILRRCDLFLPSGSELTLLTSADSEKGAIEEILKMGVASVVVKRGAQGATYFDRTRRIHAPAFAVREVDPTGAGDCFAAVFVTGWMRGLAPETSLQLANAAGARAVCARGPMEGTSTSAQLKAFLGSRQRHGRSG